MMFCQAFWCAFCRAFYHFLLTIIAACRGVLVFCVNFSELMFAVSHPSSKANSTSTLGLTLPVVDKDLFDILRSTICQESRRGSRTFLSKLYILFTSSVTSFFSPYFLNLIIWSVRTVCSWIWHPFLIFLTDLFVKLPIFWHWAVFKSRYGRRSLNTNESNCYMTVNVKVWRVTKFWCLLWF